MNLRAALFASAFVPAAAFAAVGDPCTADVTDDQGNVTTDNFTERCDGAQVIFCAAPAAGGATVETALNCAALFDGAPVGVCEDFGGDIGPNCSFADGDACVFASQTNPFIPFPCTNDDSACFDGVCTAAQGACTPGDPQTCEAGGQASFCAPWGQLIGNVCDGWAQIDGIDVGGGTLTCSGEGICGGVGVGGDCADGVYECGGGEDCVGASAESLGTCGGTATEGEGEEGEGDDDGGNGRDDEPETPPAAGCFNAYGAVPALAPLALVLVALRRRRRA